MAVIGSSSSEQTLVTPSPSPYAPQLTIASSTYTADPFGNYVIAGQTLTPGGAITGLDTPISLAQDGAVAVVGSKTQLLHPAGVAPTPVLTFNGATFTADSKGDFTIADQVLAPGSAITVSGTPISIAADGGVAVLGTSSQLLIYGPIVTPKPVLTFDGTTYTAGASSGFTINGQTLTRGGVINVNSTALSFNARGTEVVIGTSTQILGTATLIGVEAAIITVGGKAYTEDASQRLVIDGQTLTKGEVATVDGTLVSFAAAGTDVVVESGTGAVGVGGLIMSGFGNGAAQTSVVAFEGRGTRRRLGIRIVIVVGLWWLG